MEKASEVYNKLKLRFVGKAEMAAKPKTDDKEAEDDEETQNTGRNLRVYLAAVSVQHNIHGLSMVLLDFRYNINIFVDRFCPSEWGIRTEKR